MPSSRGPPVGGIWKNIQAPAATVRKSVAHAKNELMTSSELGAVTVLRPRTMGRIFVGADMTGS